MPQLKTWSSALRNKLTALWRVKPPEGIKVVEPFALDRYLGTWYEIARLDHRFEHGLEQVTATYSLRKNGGLRVVNRGFNPVSGKWRESIGSGYFLDSPQRAAFKVSFFEPFYGGYNVIALDNEYHNALVSGPNTRYLWLLSRTSSMDNTTRQHFIDIANSYGFLTDNLIWVKQAS